MMDNDIKEMFTNILRRLDIIEQKVLESRSVEKISSAESCPKCGKQWGNSHGNICLSQNCPETYEAVDVESPDPDKRSWYYDGDGTKRKRT